MKTVKYLNLNIFLEEIALMIRVCNAAPNRLAYLHRYNNYNNNVLIRTGVQLPNVTYKKQCQTIDFTQPYAFPFSKSEKIPSYLNGFRVTMYKLSNGIYDVIE